MSVALICMPEDNTSPFPVDFYPSWISPKLCTALFSSNPERAQTINRDSGIDRSGAGAGLVQHRMQRERTTLPFVIPSGAEGSAVSRTIPGNVFLCPVSSDHNVEVVIVLANKQPLCSVEIGYE
jgi:hypothetical protein